MIGMNQIKKRLIYGILIGAGVGVIGIGITLFWSISTVNTYKNGTNKEYLANYTTEIVMLNRDVIQGEKITDDMLTKSRVHKSAVPSDQAGYDIVGKVAKYNIPSNIALVSTMFADSIVDYTERIYEISSVLMPTDLVAGQYVDIRFRIPTGVEYIVMTQVKVQKISGTTMWLYLTEEQLNILNSAIVDAYVTEGSSLYAVEYVDPQTQIKLSEDTENQAMLYLSELIQKDVANGKVSLTVPDSVKQAVESTSNLNTTTAETNPEVTEEQANNQTTTTTSETTEKVNFSENLSKLILTYALEYKYYVEAFNKMKPTYQPSEAIMEHMRTNPHIVQTAIDKLDKDIRAKIDAAMAPFRDETEAGSRQKMTSGWSQKVSAQQSLRSATINAGA